MLVKIRALARIALFLMVLTTFAGGASAATCTASMSDFNFATTSVRDGNTPRIMGTLRVECDALLGLISLVNLCITVDDGDGGAGSSNSPRYMRRADGTQLAYQLYRGGYGGTVLNTISGITLNLLGSSVYEEPIFAEVIDSGTSVKGGYYSSNFTAGTDFRVTAGTLFSCTSRGAQDTSDFMVSADIEPSCTVSAGTLDFGTLGTNVSAAVTAQTTIDVSCSVGVPYSVQLGEGQGPGVSDPSFRKMTSGSNTLSYGLYRNQTLTAPWGWTIGVNDNSGTGTGAIQSIPVYGQINSGQTVPVGVYSDSVIITVNY
ncbi:Csu type fimbrial protein [Antarcticimicrobium sediminis]|nr:spore coat U domain-containing protein [Antarcticimicrobium sediminis]